MINSRMTTMAVLLVTLIRFPSVEAFAQVEKEIDSLSLLLQGKTGEELTAMLCDIAGYYGDVNNELAYNYAIRAYKNAFIGTDAYSIVRATRTKAQVLRRLGQLDSAILLFNKILPTAREKNFSLEINKILNGLGTAYFSLAKYDRALTSFFELLQRKDIDKFWESIALSNIGLVYLNLEDYSTALEYHYSSLDLINDLGNKAATMSCQINISLCLANQGKFAEARELVQQAYSNCGKNCQEDIIQHLSHGLGVICLLEGRYDEAESNFKKSLELSRKLRDGLMSLENLAFLVKLNTELKRRLKAEENLIEINSLLSKGTPYNHQIIQAYLEVISLYDQSKDFVKLAEYQRKYITLKDSIFDQRFTTNLMKIEAEYVEKENRAKIDSQAKILALNQEIIVRQKYLNLVIGIVALLLIILTIVLLRSNRQKQKMNQLLDSMVKERTLEIESSCNALHRANEERDLLLEKTSMDIHVSLATVKGLCCTGLKDLNDPLALQYFNRMNSAIENFSYILNRLQHRKDHMPVTTTY